MYHTCFSSECGLCSGCRGDAGVRPVEYVTPNEVYTIETGRLPPRPPPLPVDTWGQYENMLKVSSEYRQRTRGVWMHWGFLSKALRRKNYHMGLCKEGGVMDQIRESNIEFLKGCKDASVVYGEKRSLKPETFMINLAIQYGDIDINQLGGKVVCSGGCLFDLNVMKKTMNLENKEYEEYFAKFKLYLVDVSKKMNGYGVELGRPCQGKVPQVIRYGCESYTYTSDSRAMCDEPECSLMTHCMTNWDERTVGKVKSEGMMCYTGNNPPEHDSYYYGELIGKIPKYTKNKKHELCLLCVLKGVVV